MARVTDLGPTIAERELELHLADGGISRVTVRIGLPVKIDGESDFCCPYEISSNSKRKLRGTIGIDSVQALELTLAMLRVELENWERSEKGTFQFLGEPGYGG